MTDTGFKGLAYGPDWENSKKRWAAFWRQEIYDRPVMRVTAPRREPINDLLIAADYTSQFQTNAILEFHDFPQMLRRTLYNLAATSHFGESLPVFDHKWSVAQALAWGCRPDYNEHAAWCHPMNPPPNEGDSLFADQAGEGWRWLLDTARQAVKAANGNFFVRPDWGNHTGDILATLIGNYELLTLIADDPGRVKEMIHDVTSSLNDLYREMYKIIDGSGNEGTVNYIGCWAPQRSICLDCDISCMLSGTTFQELFLDPIVETMQEATHRMYHLDGPGALHHLSTLLDIKELDGIQWVPGAGKEPISQWFPMLKEIQKAKKSLWISIEPQELPLVQKQLSPEGLCISLMAESEEQAQHLLEAAML